MAGAGALVYAALVATSLSGGPLKPQRLLPFPDLVNNIPDLAPTTAPSGPATGNTPQEKNRATGTAKRIVGARPSAAPTLPGPPAGGGPVTTTAAPSAEVTSAPPSAEPTKTQPPRPSAEPTTGPTLPRPTGSATEGTALPAETPAAPRTVVETTVVASRR
ncbi:hypothetical protein Dfulv_07225 [Dactylosporangium fulvum]|uniref:Uncharacterized protein n=1 Tax=Dactylosporangium fulvum TaxID=53359 RepID=A0ABY5W1V8_9ACTN|nr:hypothetical protein [Dactylosporangium fulvum]UWP84038.1 hypothetical protein Dfulv_07225 [Dactylosporangium fulvum]